MLDPALYIAGFPASPVAAAGRGLAPWALTARAEAIVAALLAGLGADYRLSEGVAVHASATVEANAVLKAPAIVGPGCFLAAGVYLRGGCWLEASCRLGPGVEVKSSYLFAGAALAHFNFVGDSLVGAGANLEAGAVVANHWNERADRRIAVVHEGRRIETGATKFGALVGDGARVGANAVLSPGTLLASGAVVPRLGLVEQER